MSDCSQNHDCYQISPVSFEERGREKIWCYVSWLTSDVLNPHKWKMTVNANLNFVNQPNPQRETGRRCGSCILHPSLLPLLSLPICFIKRSAQGIKLEKEFKAMIGSMGGNLYKRRSTCPSLQVLTSKPTSFVLLLDCKICNVSCAELTVTHRMTFYCYSRNSHALRNLRKKCFLIYHKIQPFIIAIKTLNPSMKQLGKNCGFHLRKKKKGAFCTKVMERSSKFSSRIYPPRVLSC